MLSYFVLFLLDTVLPIRKPVRLTLMGETNSGAIINHHGQMTYHLQAVAGSTRYLFCSKKNDASTDHNRWFDRVTFDVLPLRES